MSNSRVFLIIAICAMGFLLWQQWQLDYAPRPTPSPAREAAGDQPPVPAPAADIPEALPAPAATETPAREPVAEAAPATKTGHVVRVVTDVLDLRLSTAGGELHSALLLKYPVDLKDPERKVQLLNPGAERYFVAQTGLVSRSHASVDHRQPFTAEAGEYRLDGRDELVVPLTWRGEGVTVTKTFRFRRGSYRVEIDQRVSNQSETPWVGNAYRQLQRVQPPNPGGSSFTNPERYSFFGAAVYTPEEKYEKYDFEDLDDDGPVRRDATGGWVGMVQHYFVTAWVPPVDEPGVLEATRVSGTPRYLVRAISPTRTVAPGAADEFSATLWVGPKLQDTLESVATGLELTVDYGIFTPFSKVLFWILEKIHSVVANWGWSIVLLTVLVKACFYKLSEAQYRSTAKMRKLQPRIQALKERYGDDRQKFNMAMMEIYKKEKVNPLGGCLPILIQIPVFLALYWVLLESVELRQAGFMLWIDDLSSPDPYFVLPIINGAAMFMTTKLSPNPAADPMQQRIMLAMPLVFSVMFAFFQAGLVLYWTVNAILSLAQQWFITKRIEAQD